MKGRKVVLDEKQQKWLILHFKHTKNEKIAQKLGISMRTVARIAQNLGLNKSKQFMKKCQTEAKEKAYQSKLKNNTFPPKGYHIPNGELYRFKKGETIGQRIGKRRERERIRKAAATLKETRKKETWRAVEGWAYGMPQQTRLRVLSEPKGKAQMRYYLKSRGYHVDDKNGVAWYDESTKRGRGIEQSGAKFYAFKPVNDNPEMVNGVNATSAAAV